LTIVSILTIRSDVLHNEQFEQMLDSKIFKVTFTIKMKLITRRITYA
jgi:hypothetical protein